MTREEVFLTVTAVFRDVLDNDRLVLEEKTTADDVEDWDSLTHIQLVVAVEKRFRIRFGSREIRGWNDVGGLVDSIFAKVS